MRVRGHSPILWRCPGQSQVGAEPGHAVIIDGLSPQEQQLLDRLPADLSPGEIYRVARWSEVPVERARAIVSALDKAGVLTRSAPEPADGDALYWERVSENPRARLRALKRAVVGLVGNGRLPRELVAMLAEAGVGTLLLEDEELSAWAGSLIPPVRTRMPLRTRPHLVVSVEGHLIEPVRARGLAAADVAQLPVVVREVSVRVGPLLAPGLPPCATCLGLWERDADPQWPAVATQLRLLPAPQIESLLVHQAAALAARAVTDVVTGRESAWVGRSLEVSGLDAMGVERRWEPHPQCLCSDQASARAVSTGPGEEDERNGERRRNPRGTPAPRTGRPPRTPGA